MPSLYVQADDVVQQLKANPDAAEQETQETDRIAHLRMIARQLDIDEDALKNALQSEFDGAVDASFVDNKSYLDDITITEQLYQALEQKLYQIFSQKQAYENLVNHVHRRSYLWSAPVMCALAWCTASCDAQTIATVGKWGASVTAIVAAAATAADYFVARSLEKREETVAYGHQQLMKVLSLYQQMSVQQRAGEQQDDSQADA